MRPLITVFTPTYNREKLIKNLYFSLLDQECKDFEWIVIDDESIDNTDNLFDNIKKEDSEFSITYIKQVHGGKHRTLNKGIRLARGRYFFIVDSDDYLLPYSIKKIKEWVEEIEESFDIAGVSGLRQYSDGSITGEFPKRLLLKRNSFVDVKNTDRYLYKLMGDKAEIYRTEILRMHPFPEFEGEDFITESVCWNAIAGEGYKIRWYNVPIYVCEYQPDGLTNSGANKFKGHENNYQGYLYQVKNSLRQYHCYEAVTFFREYHNEAIRMGKNLEERAKDIELTKLSYLLYMFKLPFFYSYRMIIKLLRIFM